MKKTEINTATRTTTTTTIGVGSKPPPLPAPPDLASMIDGDWLADVERVIVTVALAAGSLDAIEIEKE
jgi:hypothetical protein